MFAIEKLFRPTSDPSWGIRLLGLLTAAWRGASGLRGSARSRTVFFEDETQSLPEAAFSDLNPTAAEDLRDPGEIALSHLSCGAVPPAEALRYE
jgi:hypothetical protein